MASRTRSATELRGAPDVYWAGERKGHIDVRRAGEAAPFPPLTDSVEESSVPRSAVRRDKTVCRLCLRHFVSCLCPVRQVRRALDDGNRRRRPFDIRTSEPKTSVGTVHTQELDSLHYSLSLTIKQE
jgi:hypothetical protein